MLVTFTATYFLDKIYDGPLDVLLVVEGITMRGDALLDYNIAKKNFNISLKGRNVAECDTEFH